MKLKLILLLIFSILAHPSFAQNWEHSDISFEFDSFELPKTKNVVVDRMIQISPFEAPGREGLIIPPKFRLIMGYGSLSLFDALRLDEVAGLKRKDAEQFVENLRLNGKTERSGAFIAGLTNLYNGKEFFVFFNLERMNHSQGYAFRLLAHEPLHMARLLITTIENPDIDYIKDPWVNLTDANEEYFAEMLERVAAICSYYYFR